jgi:CRP/FNR family transcriptional regulator, cyclic AMP receptor protein
MTIDSVIIYQACLTIGRSDCYAVNKIARSIAQAQLMVQSALSKISLFASLDQTELDVLESHAITRTFPKHVILFNEGDRSDSLYLILSGMIKVFASDEEGNEVLIDMLGPDEYFGELALIDAEPRSASAMTLEPSRLLIIARDDFIACLHSHVPIAINLLQAVTRKLRHQTGTTKSLALKGVYERVVETLYELAEEREGRQVIENLTHQALADKTYASRAMISVILKELKEGGYISADRKRIVINRKLPAKW